MSNIRGHLPAKFKQNKVYNEVAKVESKEFDQLKRNINDVEKQLFIDLATWGLDIYEKELGITTDRSQPLQERRSVIKAKWRGTGKVDAELIKRVVDSFTNGDVEVRFDGKIQLKFTGTYGRPPKMSDVYEALDEIAPAHLKILYEYMYRTHSDLIGYTHKELSAHTHEQLREGVI